MGMTVTEKIIAAHTAKPSVEPGEFVNARIDAVLAGDLVMTMAIPDFEKIGAPGVFDVEKVIVVPDHMTPAATLAAASNLKKIRDFVRKHGIRNYFYGPDMGISHTIAIERGLALPGDLFVTGDSHGCTEGALGAFSTGIGPVNVAVAMALGEVWLRVPESVSYSFHGPLKRHVTGKDVILHTIGQIGTDGARYQAMEFRGDVISSMPMNERIALCNMAVEAGAKNGIIAADDVTREYVGPRAGRAFTAHRSDPDAHYATSFEWDLSGMEPQVACPSSPGNVTAVRQVAGLAVDQVVIGCCCSGMLEDLRGAASILEGRRVHPSVRALVIPGSLAVYREAMAAGVLRVLADAGAIIGPPTCGPCYGGHMGILAEGERTVSTTNRNFVGRAGHPGSEVFLANPYVAAASAVAGQIAAPADL